MKAHPSSFRDPDGYIFKKDGCIYRKINPEYLEKFDQIKSSGLFSRLISNGLLVEHEEIPDSDGLILKPLQIPFISYPYEWSFDQLKDAAVCTLDIQLLCLEKGFSLKDASPFNIQFHKGAPVFIDTLSFDTYEENSPWQAYSQFIKMFLAPLLLMKHCDSRLGQLLKNDINGIPLDMASKLLPTKTWLDYQCLTNIHLQSRLERKHGKAKTNYKNLKMSQRVQVAMLESLRKYIQGLSMSATGNWDSYEVELPYTQAERQLKESCTTKFLEVTNIQKGLALDIGANTGTFSEIAANYVDLVISVDTAPGVTNTNYQRIKSLGIEKILPLTLDISNPSPDLGWSNTERESFLSRANYQVALLLAVVHHLFFTQGIPFEKIAKILSEKVDWLIIEFIPEQDTQVQIIKQQAGFTGRIYSQSAFEKSFSESFIIQDQQVLTSSGRTLYLMKRHQVTST